MRAIWKGSISFGLVYIPVAVFPATREEKLSFRQLRADGPQPDQIQEGGRSRREGSRRRPDRERLRVREAAAYRDHEGGGLRKGPKIESTHSIDITDFVDLDQVDPKFFYKPYFLEPQKGGEKAYALLHKALSGHRQDRDRESRDQQSRASRFGQAGRPFPRSRADAFRERNSEPGGIEPAGAEEINDKELKMAQTLIEGMTVPWEPEKYRDEYRNAVMEMIEQKAKQT